MSLGSVFRELNIKLFELAPRSKTYNPVVVILVTSDNYATLTVC